MSGKDIREGLAFLALVVVAVMVWSWFRAPPPASVVSVPVRIPEDRAFHPTGGLFDILRDGLLMVYRRQSGDGGSELWARRWDESDATLIRETHGAGLPAISPDSREVAFMAAENPARIRVAAVQGGASRTMADSAAIGGVRWSPDGTWVYYTNASLGLSREPAGGGAPEILTRVDGAVRGQIHHGVDVLPGGRAALFTESASPLVDARIKVLNTDGSCFGFGLLSAHDLNGLVDALDAQWRPGFQEVDAIGGRYAVHEVAVDVNAPRLTR